jgi:hypothetical protein
MTDIEYSHESAAVEVFARTRDLEDARELLRLGLTHLDNPEAPPSLQFLGDRLAALLEIDNDGAELAAFCGISVPERRGKTAMHDPKGLAATFLLLRRYVLPKKRGAISQAEEWIATHLGADRKTTQAARKTHEMELESVLDPELDTQPHLGPSGLLRLIKEAEMPEPGAPRSATHQNVSDLLHHCGGYRPRLVRGLETPE